MKQFRIFLAGVALLAALGATAQAQVGPPRPAPRCLAGAYDGGQTEMAARLELTAEHRFSYSLSYGALDEMAEGKWELGGDGVLLTSDPVVPPAFMRESEGQGTPGQLQLALDVPRGISRQYFNAIVRFADGRSVQRQFAEDGLALELAADERPVSVTVLLPIFELESEAFALTQGAGGALRIRFAPNDLGKVAFVRAPVRFEKEDLLLDHHGRTLRFRRDGPCEVSAR